MLAVGIWWLIVLLQTGAALGYRELSTHSAQLGSNTTIPCKFDVAAMSPAERPFTILWHFQEKEIFRSSLKSPDPRLSIDQAGILDGIADLSMSGVTIGDGGLYACSMVHTSGRKVKEIRLDIYAPPQTTLTNKTVFINKKSILSCFISGFYPVDIDIKWLRNGDLLDHVTVEQPQRNQDGTYNIRSSVTMIPSEEDRERIFSYKIQHESLNAPLQEDFQLIFARNQSTEDSEGSTQNLLIIILPPVLVVFVVVITLIVLYKKKGRKKVAENEADQNESLVSSIPSAQGQEPLNSEHSPKNKRSTNAGSSRAAVETNAGQQCPKIEGPAQQTRHGPGHFKSSIGRQQGAELRGGKFLDSQHGEGNPAEQKIAQGQEPLNSEHLPKNKRSTNAGSSRAAVETNPGQQWPKTEGPAQQTRRGPGHVKSSIGRQQGAEQRGGTFLYSQHGEGNPAEQKIGDTPQTRGWSRSKTFTSSRVHVPLQERNKSHMTAMKSTAPQYNPRDTPKTQDRNEKFTSYRPRKPSQEQNKSHMTAMTTPTAKYNASMAQRYNPTGNQNLVKEDEEHYGTRPEHQNTKLSASNVESSNMEASKMEDSKIKTQHSYEKGNVKKLMKEYEEKCLDHSCQNNKMPHK